jgi:hypothetical protein
MRKRSLVASGAAVLGLGLVIPAFASWKDHSKLGYDSAGTVTDRSPRGMAVPEKTELAVTLPIIATSHQAELAEKGIHVGPIRFGPLVLIDVSADAARIHWLDKDVPPPTLLGDPRLLYLGSNNRVTVFMACGTTVIVPADKVVPEVLTTKDARLRKNAEPGQEDRWTFCARH